MKCEICKTVTSNYCPNCGAPLTKESIELEKNKVLNTRLETLLKLTQNIDDEKTLLIIKDLISKIKEA